VPVEQLFAHLRFVIIDEIHAFADSDRGAHLSAVLERIVAFSTHDVQRIGLSATVLNPAEIGRWMRGRSARPGRVVKPSDLYREREAHIVAFAGGDMEPGQAEAALKKQVERGKSLVFTESRMDAEELASMLRRSGEVGFVSTYHSAISLDARQMAEDAMNGNEYRTVTLTCTSAMELGIDIGDLDRALMWGPPPSVSSLLQRWGRTGRRAGKPQQTTIYTHSPFDTLTALAEVTLAKDGWVEPVRPRTRAYHILFQQCLNRVLQAGSLTKESLWVSLQGISAFRDVLRQDFDDLLDHLLQTDLLALVSGGLVLGDAAERRLGTKRFQQLITSFDTPDIYTVMDVTQRYEVGQLESWFIDELQQDLDRGESQPVILLTGRAWQVQRIHSVTSTVDVVPDQSGVAPKWQASSPRLMHERLAYRHRELLLGSEEYSELNTIAAAQLSSLRSQHLWLAAGDNLVQFGERKFTIHTFAGTRVNKTLELLLGRYINKVSSDNFRVMGRTNTGQNFDSLQAMLKSWASAISLPERGEVVGSVKPLPLSKYLPYLPMAMRQSVIAEHFLNFEGVQEILAKGLHFAQNIASENTGERDQ
jgi:ATP-dependent helicase Lhr and Lhr-like helicase